MKHSQPHHILLDTTDVAGNGGRGRVFLLPGSPTRARLLAQRFDQAELRDNPRGLTAWLGTVTVDGTRVDVASVATGMGTPSVNIVVTELLDLGARRLLRVGTAGTLQDAVAVGDLVVATASVRDESTSDAFLPREFPAVASLDWVDALTRAATAHGHADHTFAGTVHTKDAFYGREFPMGPLAEQNEAYMRALRAAGVLASEMESSHLFILAGLRGADITPVRHPTSRADVAKAGAVFAIIGSEEGFGPADARERVESLLCDVAVRAAWELITAEDSA